MITLLIIDDLSKIPMTPATLDVGPALDERYVTHEDLSGYYRGDPPVPLFMGIDYAEHYRRARRTKGLPSYTEERFAPVPAPRRPPQRILVTDFVRGYQRHRESRTRPEGRR